MRTKSLLDKFQWSFNNQIITDHINLFFFKDWKCKLRRFRTRWNPIYSHIISFCWICPLINPDCDFILYFFYRQQFFASFQLYYKKSTYCTASTTLSIVMMDRICAIISESITARWAACKNWKFSIDRN